MSPTATGSIHATISEPAEYAASVSGLSGGSANGSSRRRSQITLWIPWVLRRLGGNKSTISRWIPAWRNSTALRAKARMAWRLSLLPGETISTTETTSPSG